MNFLRRLLGLSHRGPRVPAMRVLPPTEGTYNTGDNVIVHATFSGAQEAYWSRERRPGYWSKARLVMWMLRIDVIIGVLVGTVVGLAFGFLFLF